ncbi:hypothetical protein Tco_1212887 [Tanacetum coccineum]
MELVKSAKEHAGGDCPSKGINQSGQKGNSEGLPIEHAGKRREIPPMLVEGWWPPYTEVKEDCRGLAEVEARYADGVFSRVVAVNTVVVIGLMDGAIDCANMGTIRLRKDRRVLMVITGSPNVKDGTRPSINSGEHGGVLQFKGDSRNYVPRSLPWQESFVRERENVGFDLARPLPYSTHLGEVFESDRARVPQVPEKYETDVLASVWHSELYLVFLSGVRRSAFHPSIVYSFDISLPLHHMSFKSQSVGDAVVPKFDMHTYTSTLTANHVKSLVEEYAIPLDLHPRVPPSVLTRNNLPTDKIVAASMS